MFKLISGGHGLKSYNKQLRFGDFNYSQPKSDFTTSGVYCIKNVHTGYRYVGSSVKINNRIHDHRYELINNRHHNRHLQRSFNKYGLDGFEITLLEQCSKAELGEKEVCWVKRLMPEYNIADVDINRMAKMTYKERDKRSRNWLIRRGFTMVQMLDKSTGNVLEIFPSLVQAAGFIKYNGLSTADYSAIKGKISDIACGNKVYRGMKGNVVSQTAYGYNWRYR